MAALTVGNDQVLQAVVLRLAGEPDIASGPALRDAPTISAGAGEPPTRRDYRPR